MVLGSALAVLLGVGLPALAVAQGSAADNAFRRGIEAVDRRDWPTAARAMEDAVGERPDPGGARVKIYGMRFEPYTPYFYLGWARARSADCSGALAAWKMARPSLLAKAQRNRLKRLKSECQGGLQPTGDAPEAPLTRPSGLVGAAEEDGTKDPTWRDPGPPAGLRQSAAHFLAHRYGQALGSLDALLQRPPPDAGAPLEALDHHRSVRATALLLRAACRLALFQLAGGEGSELKAEAETDVRAVRRLRPELEPSAFWFSPAFRDFFSSAAAGAP